MHNDISLFEHPTRNITWQMRRRLAHSYHQYEVIAHEAGAALKWCVKCRNLEAE